MWTRITPAVFEVTLRLTSSRSRQSVDSKISEKTGFAPAKWTAIPVAMKVSEGIITSIEVKYVKSFVGQMLNYSAKYGFLPEVN